MVDRWEALAKDRTAEGGLGLAVKVGVPWGLAAELGGQATAKRQGEGLWVVR